MVIVATGKPEPRTRPAPRASLHHLPAYRHQAQHERPARAFPIWQGKPIAPRAGLDDLAQAFQPSSPFGQARGILPLAVWLDGDQSHGQAGTMPSDRTG